MFIYLGETFISRGKITYPVMVRKIGVDNVRNKMVLMKQDFKEYIVRSYTVLQEIYNLEFQNEDDLFTLLNQLGECLMIQNSAPYNAKEIERHIDYKLTSRLQRDRELALCEIVLHRGSL